jgi:hypothetical protein
MKANCHFCQKELEANRIAGDIYKVVCDECPEICTTLYKITPQGNEYWSASIAFEDKGKEYSACYHPKLFYIDLLQTSEVDGKMEFSKRVMQLPFSPKNITPHNIKQKFQTLKVWS